MLDSPSTISHPDAKAVNANGTTLIITLLLMAPLFGLSIGQLLHYLKSYPRDLKLLKYFVIIFCLVNAVQVIDLAVYIYYVLITCRLPVNYLKSVTVTRVLPANYIHGVAVSLAQGFYALRVWILSGKRAFLIGLIGFLSLTQLVTGTVWVSIIASGNNHALVYNTSSYVTQGVSYGSAMLCELLITTSLVWYLKRLDALPTTKTAMDRIALFTVNVGCLTILFILLAVIMWVGTPQQEFLWGIFYYPLAQIYCNSILVSLNARKTLRDLASNRNPVTNINSWNIDVTTQFASNNISLDILSTTRKD